MKTLNTQMLTSELLSYREFDRVEKPAPCIPFVQNYTVAEVAEWLKTAEVVEPLELSIFEDKALLTEGNHRIAAANILNIKSMMVKVRFFESKEELENEFYGHTIGRFKTIN